LRVSFTAGVLAVPAVLSKPVVSPTQVLVNFAGTAGKTYTVLRAPAVSGPWNPIGNATADVNGAAGFTDSTPLPGSAFYQVVYP
jgi:hypothetical protein